MPKISYLQSPDNGTDTTEVTQAVIEQKIANIEALLHGLVDEDNLLTYREGTDPLRINPGVISDFPTEFKPVNHAMKFFSNETADDSVKEKSWDKIIDVADNNPSFHNIGGIQDGEMMWEFSYEKDAEDTTGDIFDVLADSVKTKTIEVPPSYIPMTWNNLWEYIKNFDISVDWSSYFFPKVGGKPNKTNFFIDMRASGNDYVENTQVLRVGKQVRKKDLYEKPTVQLNVKSMPKMEFLPETNTALWKGDIECETTSEKSGNVVVRLIVSALFKVLP
jgi:hypothetical protein